MSTAELIHHPGSVRLPGLRDTLHRSSAVFGLKITFGGILCLIILGTMGVAGLSNDANLLLLLFGIAAGVVACNAVAPLLMVRKLEVERSLPDAVVAGRPFKIVYAIRNKRRFLGAASLVVGEKPVRQGMPALPHAFVPMLPAGRERRIELMACSPTRGRMPLTAVRVTSRFPFGIFACSVDFALPAEVVIYPALGRFRSDPWQDGRLSRSGQSQRSHSSATLASWWSDEFYGLREYRQGDNLHWIHWRRSARTGQLVVREMMSPSPTQLLILLDPWPGEAAQTDSPSPGLPDQPAERLISAAATALCEGLERNQHVGLICRAAVPILLPPASGPQQRHRLLQELATAAPPRVESLNELVRRVRWPSGWHSRCLICATRFDREHESVVKFLAGRAEAVTLLGPDSELFESALEALPPAAPRSRP